ncbi:MAG: EVE domain-containing protein [Phycisphaerales bacterium]|jgi:predicted RNA-binding protein with PUA-like domain|nr:EVE domain-containing protein [Phycisphaerales bacterium]
MPTFLIKTEPGEYHWDDLVRDKRTHWSGVTNPAAQKNMRTIAKGDECLWYHTGDEKAIVGLARVAKGAYPDPDNPGTTAAGETKFVLFDVEPVRAAKTPVTLAMLKDDARFESFDLLRLPRLSVMPVPAKLDAIIRKLAGL